MPNRIVEAMTADEVDAIATPGTHAVGGVIGLSVDVAPGGSKSWRMRAYGRSMTLGPMRYMSLAEAREAAEKVRAQLVAEATGVKETNATKASRRMLTRAKKAVAGMAATIDALEAAADTSATAESVEVCKRAYATARASIALLLKSVQFIAVTDTNADIRRGNYELAKALKKLNRRTL